MLRCAILSETADSVITKLLTFLAPHKGTRRAAADFLGLRGPQGPSYHKEANIARQAAMLLHSESQGSRYAGVRLCGCCCLCTVAT